MYTGQMWLPDWGMYHYKGRQYRPDLGRFLQTDPIGYQAGMNLYAYVTGDPVNMTDPWGLTGNHINSGQCSLLGGSVIVTVDDKTDHNLCVTDSPSSFYGFAGNRGWADGRAGRGNDAQAILCTAVPFTVTGVGPNQAPGTGAISQTRRSTFPVGAVAIKPQNFGVSLSGRPSDPNSVRGALSRTRLIPNWSTSNRPGGAPAIPRGIPAFTDYVPVDVIGPASVRNSPGNHIDLYGYTSQADAFASTRTVMVYAIIPKNTAGVSCPK